MEPQGFELLKCFFTIEEPKKVLKGIFKGTGQPLQNSFWFFVEPLGVSYRGQAKNASFFLRVLRLNYQQTLICRLGVL